jgi:hypothetical protein
VDTAIRLKPMLDAFLQQGTDERSSIAETDKKIKQLMLQIKRSLSSKRTRSGSSPVPPNPM